MKEKVKKDPLFDYANYKFACDDEENNEILNSLFRPISNSILKLREMAPAAAERVDALEKKVAEEVEETMAKCFRENDEAFHKIQSENSMIDFLNVI